MNSADYAYLADFLRRRSGLSLVPEKAYLLEARLIPLAETYGISGIDGLADALRRGVAKPVEDAVVEAMTTNETSFFRDSAPFTALRDVVLPEILARNAATKTIRIWSAACSTGQEPYSIAMLIRDAGLHDWRVRITATDISAGVLMRAKSGIYNQFDVQRGLPARMLVRFFDKMDDAWVLKPDIRDMVTFRQENLLEPHLHAGLYDVIFCRNVLMYLGVEARQKTLSHLHHALSPHGVLWVGGAESLLQFPALFAPVAGIHGAYRKNA